MTTVNYVITDKMLGTPPNEDEDNDKFEELFDKFMAMKGIVNYDTICSHDNDY